MKKIIVILIFISAFFIPIFLSMENFSLKIEEKNNEEQNVKSANINEPEKIEEKNDSISMLFFGDMMFGRYVETLSKDNNNYPFEHIKEFINNSNADITFGNLEGPVMENHIKTKNGSTVFSFPVYSTDLLKNNNFNLVSLSNNHMQDQGQDSFLETRDLLKTKNISFLGDYYNRENYIYYDKNIKNSNILFIGINMISSTCEKDIKKCDEDIINEIKDTLNKDENKNSFSILFIHWGNEYKIKSNDIQKDLAHKLIDNGIDLIIGGHPHVVQENEIYKNKYIFYSLGNFIFDQYFSQETQEGLAVKIELSNLDKDDKKIEYKLFPIKSIQSQPEIIKDEKEKEKFLIKYNLIEK